METRYTLAEAPVSILLGRRGFLKVVGVCVAAAALVGYGISDLIRRRSEVLLARQDGLYRDDKLCQAQNLTASHQNPSVKKAYEDMNGKPCEGLMYDLVHTEYAPRANLAIKETKNAA
ncbi:MAG: iron hydrogenase small subunit [Sutterellaceae bacterium]|nr:iron hydrogenase small subunit [Sutterellaceae bacterium]MDD7442955.1 iron hydrogenase small subunit [Sutterellaceae bacterium]MDY2868566.1 iron hydrogenase small subunit [Mesosutterella sp.]